MIQGSEEWFAARMGKVTASRVSDILPGKSGKYLKSRDDYKNELLVERLTGESKERYQSKPMLRGIEVEPMARAAYEAITGRLVEEVGSVDHPIIKNLSASPDGIAGKRGLEIKCPNSGTHFALLLGGEIDPGYNIQMHIGMMCTGLDFWDYVDYDPRFEPGLDFDLRTFERDPELVKVLENEIVLFLAEVDAMESVLRERITK